MASQQKPLVPAGDKNSGILATRAVAKVHSTASLEHEDQARQVALRSHQFTMEFLHKVELGNRLRRLRTIGPHRKPQGLEWVGISRTDDEEKLMILRSAWEKVNNRLQTIFQDSQQESEKRLRREREPFRFPTPGELRASCQGQTSRAFEKGIAFWNCLAMDPHDLFKHTPGLQARLKMQQTLFELIYKWEFQVFRDVEAANVKSIVPHGPSMDDRVREMVEYLEEFFAPFVVHPQTPVLARDTIFRWCLTELCRDACELHNLMIPTDRHVCKIYNPMIHDPEAERRVKYLRESVRVHAETDALTTSKEAGSQDHGVLHIVLCGGLEVLERNKVDGGECYRRKMYEKRAVVVSCLQKESSSCYVK